MNDNRTFSGVPEYELKEVNPKEILVSSTNEPNVYLYADEKRNVKITTGMSWYTRLWYLLSNPFRYLFTGVWKF